MYDYEGLEEVDVEAFCVRISKVKQEIVNILREIMDFIMEYEWEEEVFFDNKDDKVNVSTILYYDEKTDEVIISLSVGLHISGFHPMGDLILDSEYNMQNDKLEINTNNCAFELSDELIRELFEDCWNEFRHFAKVQKELEADLEDET